MNPDDFVNIVLEAYTNPTKQTINAFRNAGQFIASAPGGIFFPRLVIAAAVRRARELEREASQTTKEKGLGNAFTKQFNAAFKTLASAHWTEAHVAAWCSAISAQTPPGAARARRIP